jgi:Na+/H+ antiporter NhaD/arsenite permease-like protein
VSTLLIAPFILMLLAIAVCPLTVPHWWESHGHKALVAVLLGGPIAGYLLLQGEPGWTRLQHILLEYAEFIVLLGALYTISGGIVLRGDLQATPLVNACFLGLGALLASVMGTTGASMLLIRPLLQTNAERRYVAHTVVFFIFLVSNIGGCLTPLGDPPLFLGYLRGVPFTWTLSLWLPWLLLVLLLLSVYVVWDSIMHARETPQALQRDRTQIEPLRLHGRRNVLFLGLVIAAVALAPFPWRPMLMLAAVGGALLCDASGARQANQFTYAPIIEVAVLFIGIFLTMHPVLELLAHHGASLGVNTPTRFFWVTGLLSSFLDNAPTYVTFFEAARAQTSPGDAGALIAGVPTLWLEAISLGAVLMGANTYIGNGPNFMVKAVAEEAGVAMPSFFGYMLYSMLILLPLFLGLSFVMF